VFSFLGVGLRLERVVFFLLPGIVWRVNFHVFFPPSRVLSSALYDPDVRGDLLFVVIEEGSSLGSGVFSSSD